MKTNKPNVSAVKRFLISRGWSNLTRRCCSSRKPYAVIDGVVCKYTSSKRPGATFWGYAPVVGQPRAKDLDKVVAKWNRSYEACVASFKS